LRARKIFIQTGEIYRRSGHHIALLIFDDTLNGGSASLSPSRDSTCQSEQDQRHQSEEPIAWELSFVHAPSLKIAKPMDSFS
jgi:hypothetical protein